MKKSGLVAGKHVVKYRCGWFRFVDKCDGLIDSDGDRAQELDAYDERLNKSDGVKTFDIVAVYELNEVWKREDPTITEDEKVILRNLPGKYEWIERDENGVLYIYYDKPKKNSFTWSVAYGSRCLNLFNHLFKMVQWADDEPWRIEDLLKLDVKKDG